MNDIFQTTRAQIERHTEAIVNEAMEAAANEDYSLPYVFLSDSQRLTLINRIAQKSIFITLNKLQDESNQR